MAIFTLLVRVVFSELGFISLPMAVPALLLQMSQITLLLHGFSCNLPKKAYVLILAQGPHDFEGNHFKLSFKQGVSKIIIPFFLLARVHNFNVTVFIFFFSHRVASSQNGWSQTPLYSSYHCSRLYQVLVLVSIMSFIHCVSLLPWSQNYFSLSPLLFLSLSLSLTLPLPLSPFSFFPSLLLSTIHISTSLYLLLPHSLRLSTFLPLSIPLSPPLSLSTSLSIFLSLSNALSTFL